MSIVLAERCSADIPGGCGQPAAHGTTKCRLHGGNSLQGTQHPNFKHGRYCKSLPARMLPDYQSNFSDEDALNLSADLALIDSRLADILLRVDTGECGENWLALGSAVKEFNEFDRKATHAQNPAKRADFHAEREERMRQICLLVEAGISDFNAWAELAGWLEKRRKTVETEQKRRVAAKELATKSEVDGIHSAWGSAILNNVTDKHQVQKVFEAIKAMGGKR